VIIYKEDKQKKDDFIITAFKTKDIGYYLKTRELIWKRK
jgi:hypothetical protein